MSFPALFLYEGIPHCTAHGMGTMHRPATMSMCSSGHGLHSLPTASGPFSGEEVRGITWLVVWWVGRESPEVRNFPTCSVWLFLLILWNTEQMPSRHAQGGQPQLPPEGLSSWLWESGQAWLNRGMAEIAGGRRRVLNGSLGAPPRGCHMSGGPSGGRVGGRWGVGGRPPWRVWGWVREWGDSFAPQPADL